MKTLIKLVVGFVLLSAVLAIGAASYQRDPESFRFRWKINREPPLEVHTAEVTRGQVVRTIEAPGKIEAEVEVKISAQVMGRITKLPFEEGAVVKKDQLLAQLDPEQYEAEVRSAEARIKRLQSSQSLAEADQAKSKSDHEKNNKLFNQNALSKIELTASEASYLRDQARVAMARAEIREAESSLKRYQEDLKRTTIKSPIDGIISQLPAKEGEVVVVGTMNNAGTMIMTVSQPDSLLVRARIDENSISSVKPGQKATVFLQNDNKLVLSGKVLRISPKGVKAGGAAASTSTGNDSNDLTFFETLVKIDSPPPQVRMGMNATVEIVVEEKNDVLTVPNQAVLHRRLRDLPATMRPHLQDSSARGPGVKDPARRYYQVVFVESEGKAHCRVVQTGTVGEARLEIVSGLIQGEKVIVGPYRAFDKLKDDAVVKETKDKESADE